LQFEVFRKTTAGDPCATNGNWTSVGCNEAAIAAGASALNIPAASLLANTDYYIVVDNHPGANCDFDFTITGNQGTTAGPSQTVCLNSPAINLTGFSPAGGTWSGPGITNASTGVFNPTTAGIGTHLLFYTFGPCTSTKTIKVTGPSVNISNSASVCPGSCATILGDATQPQIITTTPAFSNTNDFNIPDDDLVGISSPITASGLAAGTTIQSVCLNISHTYVGDLNIYLVCPNGSSLALSTNNGTGGDNYTNTCFNLTSAVNITSGAAPFSAGTGYTPEGGSLSSLSSCGMNGIWNLIVVDDGFITSGKLLDWTITFNNSVINTIPATSYTWAPTTAMTGAQRCRQQYALRQLRFIV